MPKRQPSLGYDEGAIRRLIGERLQVIRNAVGLSQAEISRLMNVPQPRWCRWETGERLPDLLVMIEFAARVKCTLDLIFRGIPRGSHRDLIEQLENWHPRLLATHHHEMPPDINRAQASYRSAVDLSPRTPRSTDDPSEHLAS